MRKIKYKGATYIRADMLDVPTSTSEDIKKLKSFKKEAERIYRDFSRLEHSFITSVHGRNGATRILFKNMDHIRSMLHTLEEQIGHVIQDFGMGYNDDALVASKERIFGSRG